MDVGIGTCTALAIARITTDVAVAALAGQEG